MRRSSNILRNTLAQVHYVSWERQCRWLSAATAAATQRNLLLVVHSRTGASQQMADTLERGASETAVEFDVPLTITRRQARDASIEDVLAADGYIFCAPENLASVSGEMKEFFDRTYYHAFNVDADSKEYEETSRLLGRPYGMAIAAGSDGTGAARQLERICVGWRLRPVADTYIHRQIGVQTKDNILAPKPSLGLAAQHKLAEIGGLVAATVLL